MQQSKNCRNLTILLIFGILTTTLVFLYVSSSYKPQSFRRPHQTLYFNNTYVINLKNRTERRHNMEVIASALGLDFEFFTAVPKEDKKTLDEYGSDLAPPHKACYVSHYKVWQSIAQRKYENALILEDDVDFEIDVSSITFEILRALPADWEMLYLGHCSWEGYGQPLTDYLGFKLFKSTRPACMHAYAVSSLGVKKLLKIIDAPKDPIDVELVHNIEPGNITSYSLEPPIIVQWKSPDNPSDVSPGSNDQMQHLQNSVMRSLGLI